MRKDMVSPELATKQDVVFQGSMWCCRDPFEVQRLKYFHLLWVNSENASHNSSVSLHKQYPSQKLVKVSHLIVLLIILMMNSLYIPSWFGGFSGRATGINLSSYDSSSILPVYPFQKETHCAGPRPSITTALWWPKGLPVLSSSSWHKNSTAERAILGQKGVAVIKLQFCAEKWQYKKCCCRHLCLLCFLDSKCTQCAAEKIFFLNLPLFQS